jgi:hypothetical protein
VLNAKDPSTNTFLSKSILPDGLPVGSSSSINSCSDGYKKQCVVRAINSFGVTVKEEEEEETEKKKIMLFNYADLKIGNQKAVVFIHEINSKYFFKPLIDRLKQKLQFIC